MTSKSLSFLAAATVLSVLLVSTSSLPLDAKPSGVLSRSVRGSCPISGQIYYSGAPVNCAPCNSTCTDHFPPCSYECKSGCACKFGQVIDEESNSCVDLDKCPGSRECKLDDGSVLQDNEIKDVAGCKTCLCLMGSLFCNDVLCQECGPGEVKVLDPNKCCPVCEKEIVVDPVPVPACTLRNENGFHILQEGESMPRDSSGCTTCTCRNGTLDCYSIQCRVQCADDEELQYVPYQCCPTCVPTGHVIPVIRFQ
jgi:hypothetical protein